MPCIVGKAMRIWSPYTPWWPYEQVLIWK